MTESSKGKRTEYRSNHTKAMFIANKIDEHEFTLQGEKIEGVRVHSWDGFHGRQSDIIAENRETGIDIFSKIENIKVELKQNIRIIVENWDTFHNPELDTLYVELRDINTSEKITTTFFLTYNLRSWNYLFSFDDYFIEFSRIDGLWTFAKNIIEDNEEIIAVELDCSLDEDSNTLLNRILERQDIIFRFHDEAVNRLNESKETFLATFNFPEEIKVYCKQYLDYFAKFLEDLGINANSHLKEEAGKILFSITPIDNVEALDKIREALAVYLNLPASPISDLEYSENFALMRLQQQVRNLQHSQQMAKNELLSAQYALGLAQNNIENQDQIIVRQHSTIENLNKVIEKITSNSIMTDSLDKKDKEEFEEVCEGLRIGESKWLRELTGVGLSTGKFVKAIVKNTFGKEEKNSILGLDKE